MQSQHPGPSSERRRIVICDYNALLLSVTGLLRMSGYAVFQAQDGWGRSGVMYPLTAYRLARAKHFKAPVLMSVSFAETSVVASVACRTSISDRQVLPVCPAMSQLSEEFTAPSHPGLEDCGTG
jgi:hypothetical protein